MNLIHPGQANIFFKEAADASALAGWSEELGRGLGAETYLLIDPQGRADGQLRGVRGSYRCLCVGAVGEPSATVTLAGQHQLPLILNGTGGAL